MGQADTGLAALVAGAWVVAAGWGNCRADCGETAAAGIEAIGRSRVAHNAGAAVVVVAAAAGVAAVKPSGLPGSGHGSSLTRLDHQSTKRYQPRFDRYLDRVVPGQRAG